MCDKAKFCGCRRVVTRTYRELRERNLPEIWALDTAVRIFTLHHPEVTEDNARIAVTNWLGKRVRVSADSVTQLFQS